MLDHMNLEQFYFFLSILREQMEQFYLFRSILSGAVLYVRQHIEWSNLGFIEYFVFPIRFSGYKVEVSFVLVCLIIVLTIMVGLYRDVYSLYVILYNLYTKKVRQISVRGGAINNGTSSTIWNRRQSFYKELIKMIPK